MYALLMITAIALISFLSVGFPSFYRYDRDFYGNRVLLLKVKYPLPLSLPFYASFYPSLSAPYYLIYFLTVKLHDLGRYPTAGRFILDFTFFLLINLVGAIFGYWLSKATFIERYFVRKLGKKRLVLYGILTAVLVFSTVYLLLPPQTKLSYVLDDAHLAEAEPQGTWSNMTCPQCGSKLERIVIDPADPQIMDEPWRYAAYCRQEDIFWVAEMPGFYFAGWYGPFNAHWKLTNAVAFTIVIICGVAIVLLVIRDRGLMKRYLV